MKKFFGKCYWYPTAGGAMKKIGVHEVLGGEFAVCWVEPSGGIHRVKSPNLPVLTRGERVQVYLDSWAAKRKLKEAL